MSGSAYRLWSSWHRSFTLALLASVPLLLCVVLSGFQARGDQRDDGALAAAFVQGQIRMIVEPVRDAVRRVVPLAGLKCEQIMTDLMRTTAVVPYLRSLNIIEHDVVDCSSAVGTQAEPLSAFKDAPGHILATPWIGVVGGTPMVPYRPALLVAEPAAGGRAVLAIVDDRYLLDLLQAAAPLDIFQDVELRVCDGLPLREAAPGVKRATGWLLVDDTVEIGGCPVRMQIYGQPGRLYRIWIRRLLEFLPFAALLAGVLVWTYVRVERNHSSEREQLLRAIKEGEFHVEYQPLYGVESGRCDGVEALARWIRPGIGPVRPDIFIATAEEEHLVVPLTRHLLKLIARDVQTWPTPPGFHIGVNFAAEHIGAEDFQADVQSFAAQVAARQPKVVLEITERSLIRNTEQARQNLRALRQQGVKVAIDDFGTGYCSLSYLEKFPFDLLKIDNGFVLTIDPVHGEAVVLDTIMDLAHRLGADLVAEGVETPAQFDYLRQHGVSLIQGFLFARPMRSTEFVSWYLANGQKMRMAVQAEKNDSGISTEV